MSSTPVAVSGVRIFMEAREAGTPAVPRAHSVALVLLIATLLAAPLPYGSVVPWAWPTLAVLAVILLLLWGIGCVQQGVARIFWSPLYLPAGLFLLLGVIQFSFHLTIDPVATREALIKLATNLIFFFLAGQFWTGAGSEKIFGQFGIAVTVYAFLLSLIAIVQFFSGTFNYFNYWRIHSPYGAFGPYVNRDHYAGLMEMVIPLVAAYALSLPSSHPRRRLFGLAVLLPIVSVLLTGSRGGFISLLAEIVILGVVLFFRSGPVSARRSLFTIGGLGMTAAAILFFWIDPGQMSKRLAEVFQPTHYTDASYGNRARVALDTLLIIRDHPWIGTGLGSFETAYPRYQSIPSDDIWNHAHNDFVESLADTGLIGGVLILSALLMFFTLAFRNLRARLSHVGGWIPLGAAIGCCGLLVHSFFDFNLRIPANALWFAVCIGVGSIKISSSQSSTGRLRRERNPLRV